MPKATSISTEIPAQRRGRSDHETSSRSKGKVAKRAAKADKLKASISARTTRMAAAAHDRIASASSALESGLHKGVDVSARGAEKAIDATAVLAGHAQHLHKTVSGRVNRRPLRALGLAASAGALLGALTKLASRQPPAAQ